MKTLLLPMPVVCAIALLSCTNPATDGDAGSDAGSFDDAGTLDDAGARDAGPAPTVSIAAPAYVTAGATGLVISATQTDGTTFSWAVLGGSITGGADSASVTITAGEVGTLLVVCTAFNPVGAATAVAEVTIVAAPGTPPIRFLSGSDLVPVATQGRAGLSAFVVTSAGLTHAWSIEGGVLTSPATGDSVVYTAGSGDSVTLTVTETNLAGVVGAPGSATQPLTGASLSLWAGALGGPGNLDGLGAASRLSYPTDVALGPDGTAFIVDQDNRAIRRLSPSGLLTTLTDGGLTYPGSITLRSDGGLFVTDLGQIKSVTGDGTVVTIAGTGLYGWGDGAGRLASFGALGGITADPTGALLVSDWGFGTVRKLTPQSDGGWVTATLRVGLGNPRGLAVAGGGVIYVAAASTCALTAIAGSTVTTIGGDAGCGASDGPWSTAQLDVPWGLRLGGAGALYVSETYNQTVRVVQPGDGGSIATLGSVPHPLGFDVDALGHAVVAQGGLHTLSSVSDAGTQVLAGLATQSGSTDGDAGVARFALFGSGQLAVDARTGAVLVTDSSNQTLRAAAFDSAGGAHVTTLAGGVGLAGFSDGPLGTSRLNAPAGVGVDSSTGLVWIADQGNAAVRTYSPGTHQLSTPVGGGLPCNGALDGVGLGAGLCSPSAIAVDASRGLVYVADSATHRVYALAPSGHLDGTYRATAIVGTGACDADGGLCAPGGLAIDASGTLYIADTGNNAVKTWTGQALTTIAGRPDGQCGSSDGTGSDIGLCAPQGLSFVGGLLYVADTGNGTVRRLSASGRSWSSTTELGQAGRHGAVLEAPVTLNRPTGLAATPWGDLLVLEANENAVLLYRQP